MFDKLMSQDSSSKLNKINTECGEIHLVGRLKAFRVLRNLEVTSKGILFKGNWGFQSRGKGSSYLQAPGTW